MVFLRLFVIFLTLNFSAHAFAVEESPQSFTLDGRLYSNAAATVPLLDVVTLKIQILNPSQNCILYEETQQTDTGPSNGYYTIQVGQKVGAAASKRSSGDSAQNLALVYSNTVSLTGKLASDGVTGCIYNPTAGDTRYLKLTMTPSDGVARTTTSNMQIDTVPMAIVAERAENLQGFTPQNFLQVNTTTSQLSQTNLETMLSYSPNSYLRAGANNTTILPHVSTISGDPATGLSEGQVWYDTTNNKLKYYDGAVQTLGTSTLPANVITDGGNTVTSAMNVGSAAGSAQNLNLITNGTAKVTVQSNGAVGIGTTAPGAKLDIVEGSLRIMANATFPVMEVFAPTSETFGAHLILRSSRQSGTAYPQTGDGLGVMHWRNQNNFTSVGIGGVSAENQTATAAGGHLDFATTPSGTLNLLTRMRISSSGNIGIGTYSPSARVHLPAGTAAGTSAPLKFEPAAATIMTAPENGAMEFDGTDYYLTAAGTRNKVVTSTNGANSFVSKVGDTMTGPLVNNSNSGSTALAVTQAGAGYAATFMGGSVGIGTTTPGSALEISDGTTAKITFRKTGALAGSGAIFNDGALNINAPNNLFIRANAGANPVYVYATNLEVRDGLNSPKVRLSAASNSFFVGGNVGIGTDSPSARLQVAGSIKVGDGAELCSIAADSGMIRVYSSELQFCDGASWKPVASNQAAQSSYVVASGAQTVSGVKSFQNGLEVGAVGTGSVLTPAAGALNISTGVNVAVGPSTFAGDLSVDTNTFKVDAANNRVGIGTATPSGTFAVVGDTALTRSLIGLTSSASALNVSAPMGATATGTFNQRGVNISSLVTVPTGVTDSGLKTGLWIETLRNANMNDDNGVHNGGNRGLNVAVGHYDAGASAPTTDTVAGVTVTAQGRTGTITNLYGLYLDFNGGGTVTNNFGIYQSSSLQKNYFAGKVGIGTVSPKYELDVPQTSSITSARIGGGTGMYLFRSYSGLGFNTYYESGYKTGSTGYSGTITVNNAVGGMNFAVSAASDTGDAASTLNTHMIITPAGNVGIGTTVPSATFHVGDATNVNVLRADAPNNRVVIGPGLASYDSLTVHGTGIRVAEFGNAAQGTIRFGQAAVAPRITGSAAGLDFSTINTANAVTVIDNGNVGIGVAGPLEKLEVAGNVKGVAFISTSDERLKTNIKPIAGLNLVRGLAGYSYNWRDSGRADAGVIAQEVEKVLPSAVYTNSETGFKGVNYSSLLAPVIEAIKELYGKWIDDHQMIENLQEQLKQQNQINHLLEERLQRIERQLRPPAS